MKAISKTLRDATARRFFRWLGSVMLLVATASIFAIPRQSRASVACVQNGGPCYDLMVGDPCPTPKGFGTCVGTRPATIQGVSGYHCKCVG